MLPLYVLNAYNIQFHHISHSYVIVHKVTEIIVYAQNYILLFFIPVNNIEFNYVKFYFITLKRLPNVKNYE